MATMRAISQDAWGGPEVLREVELERPEPRASEILVRVHAAGVNPTDWKHRGGTPRDIGEPPLVLGWDVSGVVEAVGFGVTLFKPGDEVFGMLRYPVRHGAYAEYAVDATRHFARKPANIDHVQAAALPIAALTAWQALVDTARVREGQRVLVHAAAGGVGHLAVQIAKARGAYVIGTASAAKHAFVRGLGADELIDYHEVDFAEAVKDVDVVLDGVGGDYGPRSLRTLRDGGVFVSIIPTKVDPAEAAARGIRAQVMLVEADHAGMQAVAALAQAGRLRPEIAAVFPLAEAARAHELGETNRVSGKIVLTV